MQSQYFLPTRIVSGHGALRRIADLVGEFGARRIALFCDPVIATTAFFSEARAQLKDAGIDVMEVLDCPVDARLTHINAVSEMSIARGVDAVVGIGGGSVMCAAKGVALAAVLGGDLRDAMGKFRFPRDPLPMILVPTTAGSGSEVSQWTVLKDDIAGRKTSVGGPQNFPRLAILDPVTLATLPQRLATLSAVDALTHAIEAYYTKGATPITDALALGAAGRLMACMRSSVLDLDPDAQLENLVAATMANMACTNAGLGLCHSMASPVESDYPLAHPVVVGALLLNVLPFNAAAAPERTVALAAALGLASDGSPNAVADRIVSALRRLYSDLGQPLTMPDQGADAATYEALAVRAVTAIARGRKVDEPITRDTVILSPNLRDAKVSDAVSIYEKSFA